MWLLFVWLRVTSVHPATLQTAAPRKYMWIIYTLKQIESENSSPQVRIVFSRKCYGRSITANVTPPLHCLHLLAGVQFRDIRQCGVSGETDVMPQT